MYNELSKFYDCFMTDVDYAEIIKSIKLVLGATCKSGADLGCGTGEITLGLIKSGLDVFGVDISAEMLKEANKKAIKSGVRAQFLQGDISVFKFLRPLDFFTAVCDTFNYIAKPLKALKNLYNNLNNNGILIFDISSEYKLKNILAGQTYSETENDITYIWQNILQGSKLYMELTFFSPQNGLYQKTTESQVQYLHTLLSMQNDLHEAGFSQVEVYGDKLFSPIKAESKRIYFVAKKIIGAAIISDNRT